MSYLRNPNQTLVFFSFLYLFKETDADALFVGHYYVYATQPKNPLLLNYTFCDSYFSLCRLCPTLLQRFNLHNMIKDFESIVKIKQ